jgi:hypothetical protein
LFGVNRKSSKSNTQRFRIDGGRASSVMSNVFQINDSMITAGFNQNTESKSDSEKDEVSNSKQQPAKIMESNNLLASYYSNKII